MAPSYINIKCLRCPSSLLPFQPPKLILQQFANVHDVSWGTKGNNIVDLSTVSTVTSGKSGEVFAAVPDEKDMNEVYEDMLHVLQTEKPKEVKKADHLQQQED